MPGNEKPKQVRSPVSYSENNNWRAYVEVDVRSGSGCMETTRLWVGAASGPFRLAYFMPPKRTATGNGMQILGWARSSGLLLVRTSAWQHGSDAPDAEQVLAVDAETGLVYEPDLDAMLQARQEKQCSYHVTDAGLGSGLGIEILVRATLSTYYDVDETEQDVPVAKRCGKGEETWSFNFSNGETKQVANSEPLQLFRNQR